MASKKEDWADISDDDEEPVPTVQLNSIDLSSLSLSEKNKTSTEGLRTLLQNVTDSNRIREAN